MDGDCCLIRAIQLITFALTQVKRVQNWIHVLNWRLSGVYNHRVMAGIVYPVNLNC